MQTRPSSHRAVPAEVATAYVADRTSPINSPSSTQEVTIAPVEAVNGPLPVDAPVEEANAVQMDANAFAEFTIGQATKARYKQILSRFALMLREEKRAGMESHSEKDIREDVLSVFPFDALQWDDVNSFTKIFYYKPDGISMQCTKTQ